MKKRFFSILFVICILFVACESQKNYMLLQSMDDEQSAKFNLGEIKIFPNTVIDTSILLNKIRSYEYYNSDFPEVISKTSDSTKYVLRIDKEYHENEDETYIYLFCEFNKNQITELFYVESCQSVWCWELDTAQIDIPNNDQDNFLKLSATMKSIDFALSNIISFPYNDEGLYDQDQIRYLKVEVQFRLDENKEILKYFKIE